MIMGVSRASLIAAKVFRFNISTNQVNANLRTLANSAGYSGYGNVEATINTNIDCYASNTSNYGLTVGTFPSGSIVTLTNNGYISGAGGAGGRGGRGRQYTPYSWYPAAQGSTGGNALNANAVSGFVFKLNNSGGTIRAGGGGGGGGGVGGYEYGGEPGTYGNTVVYPGGGGGGGGQGNAGGPGGLCGVGYEDFVGANYYDGAPYTLGPGNNGTILGAGAGGPGGYVNFIPQCYAGNGGNGGTWGQAGSAGLAGFSNVQSDDFVIYNYAFSGANGGPPGYSIVGYSKISIINAGTLQGVTNG